MLKSKQIFASIFLILVITALVIMYNYADKKTQISKQKELVKCETVHWSHHKGDHGPEKWEYLCNGFSSCGGENQSPINIIENNIKSSKAMQLPVFSYDSTNIHIVNNGHTVQFNVEGENKVLLDKKNYKLLQFHYHSLSEHVINGKHLPLEVHFVHKNTNKDYAVIGVLFEEGAENKLFTQFLNHFPKTKGNYDVDKKINLLNLLPENKSYYYYKGSLTTPPCSEVVNWYVLKNKITASKEQLNTFSEILKHNYRPTMPLNNREIKLIKE